MMTDSFSFQRRSGQRKAISLSQEGLVTSEYLEAEKPLPLVMQSTVKGVELKTWVKNHKELIEREVLNCGAVLFRNFTINSVTDFEEIIAALCGEAIEYRYRASPRSHVEGHIYTSTDYPAEQSIFAHNEHAYSSTFPLNIFFYCALPADQGGETPIGSCRRILERIRPEVREKFLQKQVMYVRNYGDGFGLPWQTVFQTTDREEVERYCKQQGIECEWKEGNRLRTRQVGPAMVKHPQTGEMVWFNHATFFHVTTLDPVLQQTLQAELQEEDLPTNTYYGDGEPIESSVLDHLREAYTQEMIAFPWQRGDVLMLDNMLAVHARRPYSGTRRVLTGMARPTSVRDLMSK